MANRGPRARPKEPATTDGLDSAELSAPGAPVPDRAVRPIVLTLAACGLVVSLMQTLVIPLLPSAPRLLHTSPQSAAWIVTATLIGGCVAHPVLGRLGDMFGKRRMILVSLSADVVGSVICAMSSSIWVVTAGRALQGIGLAVVPLSMSILRDELPPRRVASAVAVVSTTLGSGAAIGYPAAAALIQYANWHTVFWVAAAVGLIDFGLVLRYVPESAVRTGGRVDVRGALGLTCALVLLLLSVDKAASWGWLSWRVGVCFAAGVAVTAWWVRQQLRTPEPLVDLRMSVQPHVRATHIAAFAVGIGFYANSLLTSELVQSPKATGFGIGASVMVAGLCSLPGGVAMGLLSSPAARMARRLGPARTVAFGGVVMAAGYLFRLVASDNVTEIIVGTSAIACGTAFAYSGLPLLIMSAVPLNETAAANGLNTLMRSVGQAVCGAVTTSVLASVTITVAGSQVASLSAYRVLFVTAGVLSLVSTAFALRARHNALKLRRARTAAG